MINFSENTKRQLIDLYNEKQIGLEGNILKLIDTKDDEEFSKYITNCTNKDKESRRLRLDITKKIQLQNKELLDGKVEIERINSELQEEMKRSELARHESENAKQNALNDLDLLQKKKQTELMGLIVKVATLVIMFISLATTGMYIFSIVYGKETETIGPTWTNMFGILLTNSFSIVGTIMGVKYASKDKK